MSRSDYLNLNKAYLSNVKKQIKENFIYNPNCKYEMKKENELIKEEGKCIANKPAYLGCTANSTTYGTKKTPWVLRTPFDKNGVKCEPAPPDAITQTECTANGCGPESLLNKLITGFYFTKKNDGQGFVNGFAQTIKQINTASEKNTFLTNILIYLEDFYSRPSTSESNKCAIENFKQLINDVYLVKLPSSKIPLPPKTACSL